MKRGKVQPDDIIIVKDGATTGKTSFVNEQFPHFPCAINEHVFRLAINQKVADPKYVFYYLYSPKGNKEILDDFRGATVGGISQDFVNKVFIPLPPLDEQKRIASLLARADRLRGLRRTARALGDSLLQSVFLEMFGDGKGKWKKENLGNLCSLIRDGTHVTPTYVPAGIPFVTVKNMVTGKLDFSDTKFISEEEHKYISKVVKPERGDILVSKDGSIGIPCPVDTDIEFSIFVSVALLKPIREKINTNFLTYQIGSEAVQDQIQNSIKGIAIRHLHLEDFKRLEIIVPPLALQEEFAGAAASVEGLLGRMAESARQGENLFESLLAESFG